jgi:hypothetical protein
MAALPALVAATCFALAAAPQQRGQFGLARAGAVVAGLAGFVLVGDPDAGTDDASAQSLVVATLIITAVVAALLLWLRTIAEPAIRAAALGVCAGLMFGLAATFAKPVIDDLHVGIGAAAGDWRTWVLSTSWSPSPRSWPHWAGRS